MANNELKSDIRGMIEDMLTLAKSHNPNVSSIRTTISEHENEIYIDFRVMDARDNVIVKYCGLTTMDSED